MKKEQIDPYQVQMRLYQQMSSEEYIRKFLEEEEVLIQSFFPEKKEKINKLLLIA